MSAVSVAVTGIRRRGTARSRFFAVLPFLPVLGFLVIVYFVPLLSLLSRSVMTPGGQLTAVNFTRLFATGAYVDSLWVTVKISSLTALASVMLAYPLAYLITNARKPTGSTLLLCVLMPYWAGVLVRTFGWMVLLSRNGVVNSLLMGAGLTNSPTQFIYSFTGVMIGMVNAFTPLAVLVIVSAMQSIDARLLSAASTLGAGVGQRFWRVYFPLSFPGVVSALLLIFIASLGTFITPALLGSGRDVMIAQVMLDQVEQLLNWGFAGAVGTLILAATVAVFVLFTQIFGANALAGRAAAPRATRISRASGRSGRAVLGALGMAGDWIERLLGILLPRRGVRSGTCGPVLWSVALAVLLFLILPALFLVPVSFTGGSFIEWPPRGFSLHWYRLVLGSPVWFHAAARSFLVGLSTAALAVGLALPAAMALTRRRIAGQRAILGILLAPMIIPHILLAVSLFLVYGPLRLVGTNLGLVLGHTVICLPYTIVTLMTVLGTYDQRLDQAAATMGAGIWQRLRRITVPLIRPGLLAAFLVAFITSFEELTIALFVTGGLSATLPNQLWQEMLMAVSPALAAVSTLMLAFIVVLGVLIHVLRRRTPRPVSPVSPVSPG